MNNYRDIIIPFIQNNIPFNKLSVCSRAIHCASDIPGVCPVFGIHLFIHCRKPLLQWGFLTPIPSSKGKFIFRGITIEQGKRSGSHREFRMFLNPGMTVRSTMMSL